MAAQPDDGDDYTDEEARRRFEAALRAALYTPPKPLKARPPKRKESKGAARKGGPKPSSP